MSAEHAPLQASTGSSTIEPPPESPPELATLLGRHSLGIRHLVEPGPSPEQLRWLIAAALRAPDHGSLRPFRFSVVQGPAREAFADLLQQVAQAAGKDEAGQALERERALRAPMTVAVIARIDLGHPLAPGHEQWMAVGGAVANLLHAAHAMGFAGKMLSGRKARSPQLAAAFCEPGETLVGWIGLGTAARPARPRHPGAGPDADPASAEVLRHWQPAPTPTEAPR